MNSKRRSGIHGRIDKCHGHFVFTTVGLVAREYHIIDVIEKPVNVRSRSCENLVALISMVRHLPCEDHWNVKMTSLATNKAAIFVTSLEMI